MFTSHMTVQATHIISCIVTLCTFCILSASVVIFLVSSNAGKKTGGVGALVALVWFETQVDGTYVNGYLPPGTLEIAGIALDQHQTARVEL